MKKIQLLDGIMHPVEVRMRSLRVLYLRWRSAHLSEGVELLIIALLVGIFSGLAAVTVKRFISLINECALTGINPDGPNLRLLVWPLAGILLTSIYQRYVVGRSVAKGTHIVHSRLQSGKYRMSPFTIFNPLVGCSLTIGAGASGGSEGPTALSGAAIGSGVGRWFGVSDRWSGLLVAIGAGAGIAAIFKSPIGGVLYALEVLQMPMTSLPIIALIIACVLASSTAYSLSDYTFDIFFDRSFTNDPHMFGWAILLGLFCGFYCIYYTYSKGKASTFFTRLKNPWVAAMATGLTLSVGVFLFPGLFGEGIGLITSVINGAEVSFTDGGLFARHDSLTWVFLAVTAILLMKGILVAAANSGGGVSGDFVPTFFAGALAGFLFASLCNLIPGVGLPVWFFALAGMGAVMAGTVHAPMMALFILCESTDTFCFMLPYLLAVAVSYATVKILTPHTWETETGHDDILALMNHKLNLPLRMSSDLKRGDA